MDFSNIFIIIPAYNPNQILLKLIDDIKKEGFSHIVVINDGSIEKSKEIFTQAEQKNCIVLNHEKNLGKGFAIKSGIKEAVSDKYKDIMGFITIDSDAQYLPSDVKKIAEEMIKNPESLILGVRDFSDKKIPFKNTFRNKISSAFFKLSTGKKCSDTQSGLRGIPLNLTKMALEEEGRRYEYEMNFLMDAVLAVDTKYVPVETVEYTEDKVSHYHPLFDTLRVFGRFITFIASSLLAYVLDIALFSILCSCVLTKTSFDDRAKIWIATTIGKLAAAVINYTINKKYSFKTKETSAAEFFKYIVVFLIKLIGSAELVTLLKFLPIPLTLLKCIIDTSIFFISYRLQKVWVFKKKIENK